MIYTEGDTMINGVKIHYYRTGGNKPPFVLLHGATDNGLCRTPVAEKLADKYDVIMPDALATGNLIGSTRILRPIIKSILW